ncbi:hypothetical protein ACXR2U_11500 [Jatrophihabitans sp. YIM 134969]
MTDHAETAPRPKLREGGASDHRSPAAATSTAPTDGRTVPLGAVVLVGLVVLLLLAAFRPGGVAAVIGVPLAVVLPGAVLQPRFLPGLHTDPVTRWCLRGALSLAVWALVGLAVGAAGIPVRSVWPVVVTVVLVAAVVLGDPDARQRPGVSVRGAVGGVAVLVVVTLLALGARGLVALTDRPPGPGGGAPSVVASFADPTVPLALAATGARARVGVVLTNTGSDAVTVTVGGRVGAALPWNPTTVAVPAGATRTVEVVGGVPVCSDPQQAVVTVVGAGDVPPLSTVVPGAAGGIACASP